MRSHLRSNGKAEGVGLSFSVKRGWLVTAAPLQRRHLSVRCCLWQRLCLLPRTPKRTTTSRIARYRVVTVTWASSVASGTIGTKQCGTGSAKWLVKDVLDNIWAHGSS